MNRSLQHALRVIAAILILFSPSLSAAAKGDTLVLGVFPYLSASQMMEQLSPLVKRMEEALGKKITMVSAPDFLSYVERTARGEYDLVLTAPHTGRLAETRDGWQLVVQSGQKTATVLLVRKDSGLHRISDLRGRTMAVGNRRSVTYLLAEEALIQQGLSPGKDFNIVETATFSNVVQSVFLGEVDAGATPTLLWDTWQYVNHEQHDQLREIFRAKPAAPSFLVMVNPEMSREVINRLAASLLSYHETPEGKAFFRKSQFESFLPLDEATMKGIDPYVHVLLEPAKTP